MGEQVQGMNVVLAADKTQISNTIRELDKEVKAAGKSLTALKKDLALEWNPAKFKAAQQAAQAKIDETKRKVELLQQRLAFLNQQPATAGVTTEIKRLQPELDKARMNVQAFEAELRKLNSMQLTQLANQMKTTGQEIRNAGQAMLPLTVAISAGFLGSAKAAMDFESATAGVAKTTDLTKQQLFELGEEFRQLAKDKIPKAVTELLAFAEAGGQFGVSDNFLKSFSEIIAALDVSTSLKGTQGAQEMAQFAGIAQMAEENYSRLGSAIVALGNNSRTSESNIMSMSLRVASAGKQAKMSEPDIVGISAALSGLGMEAESGGTSISKMIMRLQLAVETGSAKLKEYASVANMTAGEFAKAFKDDATSAFVAFLEGLANAELQGRSTTAMLQEMDITDVRLSDTLKRLAGSGDTLKNSITTSNTAWQENTALMKEAETRYATAASKVQLAKNALTDMGIEAGAALLPIIQELSTKVQNLAEWFNELSDDQKNALLTTLAMTAAIGPLLIGIGQITIGIGGVTKAINKLKLEWAMNPAGVILGLAAAVAALAITYGALTAKQTEAEKATAALNKTLKESKEAAEQAADARENSAAKYAAENEEIEKLLPRIEELNSKTARTADEQAELNALVAQANGIIPNLISVVDAEAGTWDVNTEAIMRNAKARAYQALIDENTLRQLKINEDKRKLENDKANAQSEFDRIQSTAPTVTGDLTGVDSSMGELLALENTIKNAQQGLDALDAEYADLEAENKEYLQGVIDVNSALSEMGATGADAGRKIIMGVEQAAATYSTATDEIKKLTEIHKKLNDAGKLTPELFAEIVSSYGDLAAAGLDYEAMLDAVNGKIEEQADAAANAHADMLANNKEALKSQIASMLNQNQGLVSALASLYGQDAANWGTLAAGKYETESKLVQSLAELWSKYYGKSAMALSEEMRYAAQAGNFAMANEINAYIASRNAMAKQMEELAKSIGGFGGGSGGSSKDPLVAQFEQAVKDLDYLRDLDMIDTKTYYDALTTYRNRYLKEESEEWRAATKTLFDLRKQMRDEELKAAEEAYKRQQDAAKKAYEAKKDAEDKRYKARLKQIEDEQKAEEKRINGLIEAIDKEIEARNRLKAETSYDKTVSSLQAAIAFERDAENKVELERELARVQAEEQERLWLQEKSDERDLLEEQLARVNELAELRREKAEEEHAKTLENIEAAYERQMARLEALYNQERARINEAFELAKKGMVETGQALGDTITSEMVAGVAQVGKEALAWIKKIKAEAARAAAAAAAAGNTAARQATGSTTNNTAKTVNNNLTVNSSSSGLTSGQVIATLNNMGRD